MPWVNTYFGSAYWSCPVGWYDEENNRYRPDGSGELILVSTQTWGEDYRPEKIKVIFSDVETIEISVRNYNGDVVYCSSSSYTSGDELELDLTGDIGRIYMMWYEPFYVTEISFFEPGDPPTLTNQSRIWVVM